MAEETNFLSEIEKEKIIKDEKDKLNKIIKNLGKDEKIYAERLIEQAAFMYATLTELQMIMNREGSIELFEQGAQKLLREHPAAKTYNKMIKNYTSTVKQISEVSPLEKKEKDKLMDFVDNV